MQNEPNKLVRAIVPLVLFLVLGGGIAAAFLMGGKKTPPPVETPKQGVDAQASAAAVGAGEAKPSPAAQTPAATPAPTSTETAAAKAPEVAPTTEDTSKSTEAASAAPAATTPAAPAAPANGGQGPVLTGLHAVEYPRGELYPLGDSTPKAADVAGQKAADRGEVKPGETAPAIAPSGNYAMELRFSPTGAGIEKLTLANHFEHSDRKTHEVLQKFEQSRASTDPNVGIVPFAADAVEINGQRIVLSVNVRDTSKTFWKQISPGVFEAMIMDGAGSEIARVRRAYELKEHSYEFAVRQSVENLTNVPITVRFEQFGPADPPVGKIRYGGDVRRLRFGYLVDATSDPSRSTLANEFLITHYELLEGMQINNATGLPYWTGKAMWPNDRSKKQSLELVWLSVTSRYFAVSMQGLVDDKTAVGDGKRLANVETVERYVVPNGNPAKSDFGTSVMNFVLGRQRLPVGVAVLKTISPVSTVEPGKRGDYSFSAYAGPMLTNQMESEVSSSAVALRAVVSYTFGGPCGFCTFQTLTHLLLEFLSVLRHYITFDWAIAIMLLVVCVRTILHPVTRWSQVNLLRFGKQMQRVGPKMKALQEKYKGDPQKLREEMARLNREEGVNYAGALGCLPMFLQTPVWIALSAMLYFAFELRHQGAFFGVFQNLTGGNWHFLSDLAEPDHLISFGRELHIPLLSGFMGPVESLNILPLLMGVLFYIQQKYMSPPQAPGAMSPEMEQQIKIQKVLMVVMFPVFMYNAPSGLAIYFLTNSVLGIFESKWIRKHAEKIDAKKAAEAAANPKVHRKQPEGKKGWMDRLQERIAEAQKIREQQMKQQQKRNKGK